jgi:hypothetical protein
VIDIVRYSSNIFFQYVKELNLILIKKIKVVVDDKDAILKT